MSLDNAIITTISTYHELNPVIIDELPGKPVPLEFMRYVAKNRPFVVRSGAQDWDAVRNWNAKHLLRMMEGKQVQVAITPLGNADSVVTDENGTLLFAEPYETKEQFNSFLDWVQKDSFSADNKGTKPVKYAQTQNDNLRGEYDSLFSDVPREISFVSEALDQGPDAVNFWLGNARSTTALHKDNYENIYIQIRGKKHFTLLPPVEMPCVNETLIPNARYRPSEKDSEQMEIEVDPAADFIPVPIWDPDQPKERATPYSRHSKASRVTLNEGDIMYLPAMWYHKVKQTSGDEGFACSVNYWYDMDFSGGFWTHNAFIRDIANAEAKQVPYPDLALSEDPEASEK